MADPVSSSLRVIRALKQPRGVIRAFHGSPHSFSRFDASKIGTGEGAQAFGHGLYFAGNEGVARSYRDISPAVPSGPSARALQELAEALVPLELEGASIRDAMEQAAEARGELSDRWGNIRSIPPDVLQELGPRLQAVNDEINRLRMREQQIRNNSRGHMYEVEIGYPEDSLLDLDLPVQSQPQFIKDALGKHAEAPPWFSLGQDGWVGKNAYMRMAGDMADANPRLVGGYYVTHDQPAASAALLQAGVPGIRYFDGGSRHAGPSGTRNYVMFPGTEDRIRILRQYGLIPPMAAGLMQDEEQ